jgi:hypothetical protein
MNINCNILCHFSNPTIFNTIFGAGAVGAGVALRYVSGSGSGFATLVACHYSYSEKYVTFY